MQEHRYQQGQLQQEGAFKSEVASNGREVSKKNQRTFVATGMPATVRMLAIGMPEQQGRQQPQGCQKQPMYSKCTNNSKETRKEMAGSTATASNFQKLDHEQQEGRQGKNAGWQQKRHYSNRRDTTVYCMATGRVPSIAGRLEKVEMLATVMTPATAGSPGIAWTPVTKGIKW